MGVKAVSIGIVFTVVFATLRASPPASVSRITADEAAAYRIIARIESDIQRATWLQGQIVRNVKVAGQAKEAAVIVPNDYSKAYFHKRPPAQEGVMGPAGSCVVLDWSAMRFTHLRDEELVYSNSEGFDADGKVIPLRLHCLLAHAPAYSLGDFLFIINPYEVKKGKALVPLDSDPFCFAARIRKSLYIIPAGSGFMGPGRIPQGEKKWLAPGKGGRFQPLEHGKLAFGVHVDQPPASPLGRLLISSVSMMGVGSGIKEFRPPPHDDILLILDLRVLEKVYGPLMWVHYELGNYVVGLEGASLTLKRARAKSIGGSSDSRLPIHELEYPFLVLKGPSIQLEMNADSRSGLPGSFAAVFQARE